MSEKVTVIDPIAAVALLDEPRRRRLYDYVAHAAKPVGRDEAAGALEISRELAAFHLDRLVEAGLLRTEYRRLGARRGPGAGRPAKLYRPADGELEISLPPRRYERAAAVFAEALANLSGGMGAEAAGAVARTRGESAGTDARRLAGSSASPEAVRDSLLSLLDESGYEPGLDSLTGEVRLHNCPYRSLSQSHRELTCRMNVAWAEGVVAGLADPTIQAASATVPGGCCAVFRCPGDKGN